MAPVHITNTPFKENMNDNIYYIRIRRIQLGVFRDVISRVTFQNVASPKIRSAKVIRGRCKIENAILSYLISLSYYGVVRYCSVSSDRIIHL